jgi:hypothetical protein
VDRPRAQLDYYPTLGSAPIVYALADRGVRLLRERDGANFRNAEWSRKNREAGRPFIEHQISIVDFQVALRRALDERADLRLLDAADMLADVRDAARRNPFALRAKVSRRGTIHDFGVIPDLVFGLQPAKGARRNFAVEIDRGTMPVRRSDFTQTSIERKMLVYLAAHTAREHERQLGWKNFRVLVVTNNRRRMQRMIDASRQLHIARVTGASLFLFTTFDDLRTPAFLAHQWTDGNGRATGLV